ncbi:MAG TPA: hypothetical protein VLE96_07385 [Chlamydiales bacterium]|nr:hypothetical protein [Chlamydiales bacterium]
MTRVLFLLTLSMQLFAHKVITPQQHSNAPNPWFTGPLLCPSDVVVTRGHFNFEPYVYFTANTGAYNSHGKVVEARNTLWSTSIQPVLSVGLTKWMDMQIVPGVAYNSIKHHDQWVFQDFIFTLDFQLLKPRHIDDWYPFIKFLITEMFPTGKYQHLNPKKLGVDIGGTGSYRTATGFVLGKLFQVHCAHFLNTRLSLQYELPAPVHLHGFNAYGGSFDTNARFFPGQNFEADLGLEYTLSKHWVIACDFVGLWTGKPHFSGNPGTTPLGTPAPLGAPGFSIQYSMAPAIEYNWSANLGAIAGCWFTFAGKNAGRFWSAVAAFNYYR